MEYGLLIAGIAAIIATAVYLFGGVTVEMFTSSCDTIATATKASAACS